MNKKLIWIIVLTLAMIFTASCSGRSDSSVETDNVSYEGQFEYNTFAGVAVSAGEARIEMKDGFEVSEIKVNVGDSVKEGDVLFVYDTQKAQLDLERAKLELEQLQNNQQNLIETKERLENEKSAAPADQQLSYSLEIRETDADILEGEYNIKTKTKEIESLSASLEITEEKSPVTGKVNSINKDGSDSYGNPQPFMVITETGSMRVQGYINENNMSDINIGMPVTIKSRIDDMTWTGTVSKIDTEKPEQGNSDDYYDYDMGPSVDSSSKYPFYVDLDDSEGLLLGQHVYIIPDYYEGFEEPGTEDLFYEPEAEDSYAEYGDFEESIDMFDTDSGD